MSFFDWMKRKEETRSEKEVIVDELELNSTAKIIEMCEQMIEKAKELNDIKEEYRKANAYLNDIILFHELPSQQQKDIRDIAYNISQLEQTKQNLMHVEKKITDAHFNQFEMEENEIPVAIERLKENEKYLAAVERDMNFLENEKMKWKMYTDDLKEEQVSLRRVSIAGFSLITIIFTILLVLQASFGIDTKIYWMIAIFVAGVIGAFVFVKLQNNEDQKKKTNFNRNQAISLLNKMKIRYVNAKNAVDYSREKYHVRNAKEFKDIWEKYLETVKQKEKYEILNQDMDYFEAKLRKILKEFRFNEVYYWTQNSRMFFEEQEEKRINQSFMSEREHNRTRIEFLSKALKRQREETHTYLQQNNVVDDEVQSILDSIDKLSGISI